MNATTTYDGYMGAMGFVLACLKRVFFGVWMIG